MKCRSLYTILKLQKERGQKEHGQKQVFLQKEHGQKQVMVVNLVMMARQVMGEGEEEVWLA